MLLKILKNLKLLLNRHTVSVHHLHGVVKYAIIITYKQVYNDTKKIRALCK